MKFVTAIAAFLLCLNTITLAQKSNPKSIYSKDNLIAWCIVPFDSKNRNSEERAQMLNDLGINKLAYDWREKHVPTFDDELNALNRRLVRQVTSGGRAYLTEAHAGGAVAMRIGIANVLTAESHLADAWTLIHDAFDRTLID